MRLAIVSDSHGSIDRLDILFRNLEKANITHLLHCGDCFVYGFSEVLEKYPSIKIWIALGNNDTNQEILQEVEKLPHVTIQDIVSFELDGISFASSHFEGEAQKKLKNQSIDIFCHGHTHQQKISKKDGVIILNPGALTEDGVYFLLSLPNLVLQKRLFSDKLDQESGVSSPEFGENTEN